MGSEITPIVPSTAPPRISAHSEEPDCSERRIGDGFDSSRDIVQFTMKESPAGGRVKVQFEMDFLKNKSAEYLDLCLLMKFREGGSEELPLVRGKTASPWNLAAVVKDPAHVELLTPGGSLGSAGIHEVKFDTASNTVSFEIDSSVLEQQGRRAGDHMYIQGYTVKDNSWLIADAMGARSLDERGYLAGGIEAVRDKTEEDAGRRWEDEIIYWAMTDRFCNGDRLNDLNANPANPNAFHGGDWQGIIDKLDYLKDLGFTTVWISPVVQNDKDFFGSDGYHGYWPHDFFKTEENFGTLEKLQELVSKAHQKGLKVVVDLVLNHTGYNNPMGKDPKYYEWFHHAGSTKFVDSWSMEHGSFRGLPDFAQERPEVSEYLKKMGQYWVEKTGLDAFRIDAAKHMPKQFLKDFTATMHEASENNCATIGEAYFGEPKSLCRYQKKGGMDLLFDTPLVDVIRNSFTADSQESKWGLLKDAWKSLCLHPYDAVRNMRKLFSGNTAKGFSALFRRDELYDNPHHLVTFMDNHDMSRFLTIAGADGKNKMKLAITFLMTARGVPAIYYGTEDSMGLEPDTLDRADKKWGNDPEMAGFLKKLTHLRKESPSLRRGRQKELYVDKEIYAFNRIYGDEESVVIMNCSDKRQQRDIPLLSDHRIPLDGKVCDAVTGIEYAVSEGKIHLQIDPKSAVVLRCREDESVAGLQAKK